MIVIVHGYDGSGPAHWQRWLAEELARAGVAYAFPELPAPTEPDRDAWLDALAGVVGESPSKVTFVAHSLGSWAVDHFVATRGTERLHAALLVAPPSPFSLFEPIQSFLPPPRSREAWAELRARTLVLGSDDDEYAGPEEFTELAARLDVAVRILPGAGHINAAAGFGPLPLALDWLREVGAL